MSADQYPKKQHISYISNTFGLVDNMLSTANMLLFELEHVRNTPENLNKLPTSAFDKFVQLLPILKGHCVGWRSDPLTIDQLKKVEDIECSLDKIETCCLQSRVIMDYLLLKTIQDKTVSAM